MASQSSAGVLLDVKGMSVVRGKSEVVHDCSFSITRGTIMAFVGPNGAGKSSTVDGICGFAETTGGTVRLDGSDITGLEPHRVVREGIIQVSKDRDLFEGMSVKDNLVLGRMALGERASRPDDLDFVFELFPRLKDRLEQSAGSLSGGEQQMLAIGRALMGNPSLLMLDEPTSGLAPSIVVELMLLIEELSDHGLTILLIEQNVETALEAASSVLVMRHGRVVFEGAKEGLGSQPLQRVSKLFMGSRASEEKS